MARPVEWRGRQNAPDLVVIDPPTVWLELKNPNRKGRVRPGQAREHKRMSEHGALIYVIDNYDAAVEILTEHYPGHCR